MRHHDVHPQEVEGCYGCYLASIRFNTSEVTKGIESTERQWDRDMPAYKRLRDSGLHPRQIDGSAKLEQGASTRMEVEMGHLIPKEERSRVAEGMALSKEMGLA